MLAAGLRGIEKGYELPPEATNNIYEMTPEERMAEGIDSLPNSLSEALDVMERSDLVAEVLGEHVFDYFLRNKRLEWADYKSYVTPFEINRYLGTLWRPWNSWNRSWSSRIRRRPCSSRPWTWPGTPGRRWPTPRSPPSSNRPTAGPERW